MKEENKAGLAGRDVGAPPVAYEGVSGEGLGVFFHLRSFPADEVQVPVGAAIDDGQGNGDEGELGGIAVPVGAGYEAAEPVIQVVASPDEPFEAAYHSLRDPLRTFRVGDQDEIIPSHVAEEIV